MTETKEQERKALLLEIKAHRELIKRLTYPKQLLADAAQKEKNKRAARIANAQQYKSETDAQDAYGWGLITEEEYYEILKALELGKEYVENTTTPAEIANTMLGEYIGKLYCAVASLEFEALPENEKEEIRQLNEEIMQRRKARIKETDS